jgi:sugar phosphate isomerase/epimerase
LQNFDPRYVGFQYDTHHLMQAFDAGWVHQLRMGGPYIGGFVWKDIVIEPAGSPNPDDAWRAANTPPQDAAAGGAGGGGGGRFGGGGGGNNPFPTKTRIRQVPVGTGMVNLPLIAATLKEIGFDGPMECEPEWPQLGGANGGRTELTISPEECIALLKRDKQTMDAVFATAGLL